MSKKNNDSSISHNDVMSFLDAMSDVKRLKHNIELHEPLKPKPVLNQWANDDIDYKKSPQADETIKSMSEMEGVTRLKKNNVVVHKVYTSSMVLDHFNEEEKALKGMDLLMGDDVSFKALMKGVSPLQDKKIVLHDIPKPLPVPQKLRAEQNNQALEKNTIALSDEYESLAIRPEDVISYRRDGVQKNVFKKLRSGSYRVVDELDLHGMTGVQAREVLSHFLLDAKQLDNTCVRIIHGKGKRSNDQSPVLKRKVDNWLRQCNRVLAFHSALPVDGGTGALYLLLKRITANKK